MTTVTENIDLPGLALPDDAVSIEIALIDADQRPLAVYHTGGGLSIISPYTFRLATNSIWSLDLKANSEITPGGTTYRRIVRYRDQAFQAYFTVPAVGGPFRIDELLTDPPAAIANSALATHANDTSLHGGGQRLAIAHLGNQLTASTAYVDLPGATFAINNPTSGKLALVLDVPASIEESTRFGRFRIVAGATTIWERTTNPASVANQAYHFSGTCELPNTLYTPVPGALVTYKVQWNTSVATSDFAIVTEFGGPAINSGMFEALSR